jgi:hypothetical protein
MDTVTKKLGKFLSTLIYDKKKCNKINIYCKQWINKLSMRNGYKVQF